MDLTLYASLAGNALAAIGGLVLAAKLATARQDVEDWAEANENLRIQRTALEGTINGMRADAAEGMRSRLQREKNLRKMQARNRQRNAEKAAARGNGATATHAAH